MEKYEKQALLYMQITGIGTSIFLIDQCPYPHFLEKLKEYVDAVLRKTIPTENKIWDWKECLEIEDICRDIVSLLEHPKELGYFGKSITLQDVFVGVDSSKYLPNLKEALQRLDDKPHKMRKYVYPESMRGLLRAQWRYINDYLFESFDHLHGPYTRFWDKFKDQMHVFDYYDEDALKWDNYKWEAEKKACDEIIRLLLDPGNDNTGNPIDVNQVFYRKNQKIDWQKYLRNLQEVLEKVKIGKPFDFDLNTYRVVKKDRETTRALLKRLSSFDAPVKKEPSTPNEVGIVEAGEHNVPISLYPGDENEQRIALQYNWRTNIQAFQEIFDIAFNMDTTFEKKCYLGRYYLCTVAHNESNVYTGHTLPGTKNYNLVVTWPDGRNEDWTLSFYIWNEGEKKGRFMEMPGGRKFECEFLWTRKNH